MRKMTAIVTMATFCFVVMTAPALAQKDPFHPVIDPDAGTVVVTGSGTVGSGTTTELPPDVGSDSLAPTGSDVSPWLAIAYTLILLGAGAIVIARMHRPEPIRAG